MPGLSPSAWLAGRPQEPTAADVALDLAAAVKHAILHMEPGDTLIVNRHTHEPGKNLFTIVSRDRGGPKPSLLHE